MCTMQLYFPLRCHAHSWAVQYHRVEGCEGAASEVPVARGCLLPVEDAGPDVWLLRRLPACRGCLWEGGAGELLGRGAVPLAAGRLTATGRLPHHLGWPQQSPPGRRRLHNGDTETAQCTGQQIQVHKQCICWANTVSVASCNLLLLGKGA